MSDTLHVVALPHTQTTDEYVGCAYTSRVKKFCKMMTGRDRKVILYSGDQNDSPCDEHVVVFTEEQRREWYGEHDPNDLGWGGLKWEWTERPWMEMNARVVGEIKKRRHPHDLICLAQGISQRLVADALPENIVAEIMVGYEGILIDRKPSPAFAAFESHTHRHFVYGLNGWRWPRKYDTVIPNQFDPDELPYSEGGGGYLLYIGRLVDGKDVPTAARVAEALGMKLVVAGSGGLEWGDGFVRFAQGEARSPGLEYVGPVGVQERAALMGGAAVTIVPTIYQEPFGGVAVESMMCGSPVVTTDFGAFVETVKEGVSGYRFQTLQEAVDATERAMMIPREWVREWAVENYSLDALAPAYDRWFDNLDALWGEGWTALRAGVPSPVRDTLAA